MNEEIKNFLDKINFHRLLGTNKTWNMYDIFDHLDEIFPGLLDDASSYDLYDYLVNRYRKENQAWFTEEVVYYVKFKEEENNVGF